MSTNVKKVTTIYGKIRQPFRKVVRQDGKDTFVTEDGFMVKEKKQVLSIDKDNRTITCVLDDGEIGVSKCMDSDDFNETKGTKIAYLRAKIKSLQKELDELTK